MASIEHGDALLELAYLMTAADGRLVDAELAAYQKLVTSIRGAVATREDVSALIARFADAAAGGIEQRMQVVARGLPFDLRELAFMLAIGLALVDGDAHDSENALVGVLFESLDLSEERADVLAGKVRSAFA